MSTDPYSVAIIGTGYVADLYMASLKTFPHITVIGAFDTDPKALTRYTQYWGVQRFESIEALLTNCMGALILNLTSPQAHYHVSLACLQAGYHVYSEKPLATEMADAQALHDLAKQKNLILASAPCSVMGEAAQTVWKAVEEEGMGTPRLIYAELDDDFIPQAPYQKWRSVSGAPWPADNEFHTGCTLEHAGYYLTWLLAMFGPVEHCVAASADVIPNKTTGPTAPDYATGILFFKSGIVARLTCSIIAKHNHQLQIFGDKGVLQVKEAWNNGAAVRVRRRVSLRRRLITLPWGRRIRLTGRTPPKVPRSGATAMNYALGPVDILQAIAEGRSPYISNAFSLHLTEVALAIQNAGRNTSSYRMQTRFEPFKRLAWAK